MNACFREKKQDADSDSNRCIAGPLAVLHLAGGVSRKQVVVVHPKFTNRTFETGFLATGSVFLAGLVSAGLADCECVKNFTNGDSTRSEEELKGLTRRQDPRLEPAVATR